MDAADNAMISGFLINKFRGDPRLFDDGYRLIETRTGWQGFGVVPFFPDARKLPAEDALDLPKGTARSGYKIAALTLSRIANFDDLDPLAQEPDISLTMVRAGEVIAGDTDLVIIPGSKSTRGDLAFLRLQGWDIDLAAHLRRGGRVLGICGGYQMLGHVVRDPEGIEGPAGETLGLEALDVETLMSPDKRLTRTDAMHAATGLAMQGYEIHIGRTDGPDRSRPFAYVAGQPEGAVSRDGRVMGSYLHGMFANDTFRAGFLKHIGAVASGLNYGAGVEATLDALAAHLETHIDVAGLLALAR
jgi:adenosylcobyric acid synthase